MKRLIVLTALLTVLAARHAFSDPLIWTTPLGTIGLPFASTELLAGYDIKYNQGISGVSLPIWTLPEGYAQLQVGAVGAWATQALNAQPYIAFGKDFARLIPVLSQYKSAHLNAFGRWATDSGDKFPIGYGVSGSYSFGGADGAVQ